MRKILLTALLICSGISALAQTASVTTTIVDSDSITWANGTYALTFVPPSGSQPGQTYTFNGLTWTPPTRTTGLLSGSGGLSLTGIQRNDYISPAGTSWQLTFCPLTSPGAGNNCSTQPITLTAATNTPTFTVAGPRFNAYDWQDGIFGYADVEVTNPPLGSVYLNLPSDVQRLFTTSGWVNNGGGGGGGATLPFPGIVYGTSGTGGRAATSGDITTLLGFTPQVALTTLGTQVTCTGYGTGALTCAVVRVNGAAIPTSATLVGTNSSGQFIAQTGTITNATSGNAATATALAGSPTTCTAGSGSVALGVAASGNATCHTLVSGDIPNNAANTSGTAAVATVATNASGLNSTALAVSNTWSGTQTFNNLTVTGTCTGCGGGGGGAVSSVFSRTGAVVAATNDYNFNQLAGTASLAQGGTGTTTGYAATIPASVIAGALACSNIPALTGDTTGTSGSCATVTKALNGTLLSGLATGILKNTTSTGVPSIAVAGTDYAGIGFANVFTQNQTAPSFIATGGCSGGTTGCSGYTQGSAPSSAFPANTAYIYAPSSVTSYGMALPIAGNTVAGAPLLVAVASGTPSLEQVSYGASAAALLGNAQTFTGAQTINTSTALTFTANTTSSNTYNISAATTANASTPNSYICHAIGYAAATDQEGLICFVRTAGGSPNGQGLLSTYGDTGAGVTWWPNNTVGIGLASTANEPAYASSLEIVGSIVSIGTTFTATGCGTPTSLTGGQFAGSFVANSTSCAAVVTPGITAPHGWFCKANDLTTPADAINQTASTTTTFTLTGTVVSADVINFGCTAY